MALVLAMVSGVSARLPGTKPLYVLLTGLASCAAFYSSARHFCLVLTQPALEPRRIRLWRNVDRLRIASRATCYASPLLLAPMVGAVAPGSSWLAITAAGGMMLSGTLEGAFRALGQRLAAQSARTRMQEDERQPVVYLRAFADDGMVIAGSASEGALLSRTMTRRLEAMLAEWFERVGPFVALGRPGERLPLDGAARDYAGDDWRAQVNAFLERAQSIVLVVSGSAGVEWEVQRIAAETRYLTKTLWLMPNVRRAQLLARWRACAAQLIAAAPKLQLPPESLVLRSCFVYFDASGRCHCVGKRRAFLHPYQRALERLLDRGMLRIAARQTRATHASARAVVTS